MIKSLSDPANAITACGLGLASLSILLCIGGQVELSLGLALWAVIADHVDGVVARRTRGRERPLRDLGKNLDSLADLVSAGLYPAVMVAVEGRGSLAACAVGIGLVQASALRLSYFGAYGLDGGSFLGVPTSWVLPVLGTIFCLAPVFHYSILPALYVLLPTLAVLHVAPVHVRPLSGPAYPIVIASCVAMSLALLWRSMG